jgi:hypothetical protein
VDWTKETQDMFKSWIDVQTKTWQSLLKSAQEFDASNPAGLWEKTVDAWQDSIKGTLEAQIEGSRIWAEGLTSIEGAPKETQELANQVQKMTKDWTSLQQQMWNGWFEVVRKADPAQFGGDWDANGVNMLKTWQDMVQKMMSTQSEMMKNMPTLGEKKG